MHSLIKRWLTESSTCPIKTVGYFFFIPFRNQNNLASKKREQMKIRGGGKLPELAENPELDELALNSTTVIINGSHTSFAETNADKMPQVPVEDVSTDVSSMTFSENPVTPSLPDSLLKKLGLAASSGSSGSSGDNFRLVLNM